MIGSLAYGLCALTSLACFILLLRSYLQNKVKLLLWSGLCFFFLSIQNVILFVDLVLFPTIDLVFWRTLSGFIGPSLLLFALIWEKKNA